MEILFIRGDIMNNKNILSNYPNLSKEWNADKNGDLTPMNVTLHSNKKVWWMCSKGHEWQAIINNRSKGSNCPYCSGRYATPETCLANVNPNLSKEWHPTKNKPLTPYDVTSCSSTKVWWLCPKGHEWQATIKNRTYNRGCPDCSSGSQSSFQEIAIKFYLDKIFDKVDNRVQLNIDNNIFESDIYIYIKNNKSISIEYCGYLSHLNKQKQDQEKSNALANEYFFISVRELGLPKLKADNFKVIELNHRSSNFNEIDRVIKSILKLLFENNYISIENLNLDINCKRDSHSIYELLNYLEIENSLATLNPELLSEFDFEKNPIKPEQLSIHSGKLVWWKCSAGHKWQAPVDRRVNGSKCPFCRNRKVDKLNCLATTHPELAQEWNTEKNGSATPNDYTSGSHFKAWWKCPAGHEWKTAIYHRSHGQNCPTCYRNNTVNKKN